MQHFDPTAFLEMPVTDALEARPPVPAIDYPAQILEVSARQWQSKDKVNADGTPKAGVAYDVVLELQLPPDVQEAANLKSSTLKLKDSIMLDLAPTGGLDTTPGANRQLRQYREALDMNRAGTPFRASDMVGKMLMARVKHDVYNGAIQERIGGVARLG